MPSTITTYYTFQPATKARSSQVNTNFSNYRGDLLPINENTVSASNHTHYLGASDHYWAGAYLDQIDLRTSTTTATLILKGDTSNTTGAFLFQIEGSTVAQIGASGIANSSIEASGRTIISLTFTGNSTFTIPAGVSTIRMRLFGGGGGGGAGAGSGSIAVGGGSGGNGAFIVTKDVHVTPGEVLSITVGVGGSGGAATSGSGPNGSSGTSSFVERSGSYLAIGFGGAGGIGAATASSIGGAVNTFTGGGISCFNFLGGRGGNANNSASSGQPSFEQITGGAGGAGGASKGGGGGGGGSSYGLGGQGQDSTTTGTVPVNSFTAGYGAGGGGGAGHGSGGSPNTGGAGAPGGAGLVEFYYSKTT